MDIATDEDTVKEIVQLLDAMPMVELTVAGRAQMRAALRNLTDNTGTTQA